MRTLPQLATALRSMGNQPHALAELDREISEKYANLCEEMKRIQVAKAIFTTNKKFDGEKPKSDSYCESLWLMEEDGKSDLKLKYELKGLERLGASIKNSIVVASIESKNNA